MYGALWCADQVASGVLFRKYPAPGRMVAVDRHRLHLYCTGEIGPTVVIETGLGVDWTEWRLVSERLADFSRVCFYDRAGYGWSEPGPQPRTAFLIADELHRLLSAARVNPPCILVAHSFGGYSARVFADRFPDSLRGLVLVDPIEENEPPLLSIRRKIRDLLPPLGIDPVLRLLGGERMLPADLRGASADFQHRFLIASSLEQQATERSEKASLLLSARQAHAAQLPKDLPLTVITSKFLLSPTHFPNPMENPPLHFELQTELAASSSHGRQILATRSGHSVQLDEPELIVDAVREMAQEPLTRHPISLDVNER